MIFNRLPKIKGYKLLKKVGEGRYSKCYLANNEKDKNVIIKCFRSNIFNKNKDKNFFEATILSKINNPNVPELLGVINENGIYAFVLEYKFGETLENELFKQKKQFSFIESVRLFEKLLEITKYMHDNQIVHRDIRIPNIILNENYVYLVDFGLARWFDKEIYPYDLDFSYLGDILLYLLYSTYQGEQSKKGWYNELDLTEKQTSFLKKMMRIEKPFNNINEVISEFNTDFKSN